MMPEYLTPEMRRLVLMTVTALEDGTPLKDCMNPNDIDELLMCVRDAIRDEVL